MDSLSAGDVSLGLHLPSSMLECQSRVPTAQRRVRGELLPSSGKGRAGGRARARQAGRSGTAPRQYLQEGAGAARFISLPSTVQASHSILHAPWSVQMQLSAANLQGKCHMHAVPLGRPHRIQNKTKPL